MVRNLRRSLPNIQEDIDRIYYACFDTLDVETKLSKGVVIYQMNGESFANYMQSAYGVLPPNPYKTVVNLTTSNILQDIWASTFGAAFNTEVVASSNEFSFPNDFNCLNPSTLELGFGEIISIDKNIILVAKEGKEVKLKLGACSRVESTVPLPAPGQTVYWKANFVGEDTYEVYTALCL